MPILVTGGAGFLGKPLVESLLEQGEDVVVFDLVPSDRLKGELGSRVKAVTGDTALLEDVLQAVRVNSISDVFHMAALLSIPTEEDPLNGLKVDGWGTVNVLEAARLADVDRVIFPSSVATYGPDVREPVDEHQRQEPRSVYGIAKVLSELWGLYYFQRFRLDFRALRLPAAVGPGKAQGVAAYASLMIEKPARGEPYEAYVREDTTIPIIYYKESVNALCMLYRASSPNSRIYNLSALTPKAKDIAEAVKAQIPSAQISFSPKEEMLMHMRDWPLLDATKIREELGWTLRYDLKSLVTDFIAQVQSSSRPR